MTKKSIKKTVVLFYITPIIIITSIFKTIDSALIIIGIMNIVLSIAMVVMSNVYRYKLEEYKHIYISIFVFFSGILLIMIGTKY